MKDLVAIRKSSRDIVMPETKVSLQVIWIGKNWETMGLTARSGSILEIAMGLAITKVFKDTRMLMHLNFPPKTIFCEKRKANSANLYTISEQNARDQVEIRFSKNESDRR